MLKSIGDGVIATDTDGTVMLLNKVAEELTGWSSHDAVGRKLDEVFSIIDEQTGGPCISPVENVLKGKTVNLSGRIILVNRDGTERLIADSAAPIRDRDSRIAGAIIVFRDVTEKRKLEAEILKNQKLESLGLFAGGIAHDFNNLLTGILGNVSLAKMYAKSEHRVTEKLDEAEKASLRARDLTQQLLTFSKGGSPVKKAAFVTDLIRDSVNFVLSGSNIKSSFNIPDNIRTVEVDEGQFSQVINNLTINAIQAMPEGGTITITVENIYLEPQSRFPLPAGMYVKISLRDEGTGIPADKLANIFDPFYTTKPEGNGLGLTTSYSIIRKHDGHIECESKPGKGSTFHIYLPASNRQVIPKQEHEGPGDRAPGKGRILLMDDEDMILKVGVDILTYLGYEVLTAHDGKEFLKIFRAAKKEGNPFYAVIMDLTIPGGMGGRETISKLLKIDPHVKAVVSSGYSNDPILGDFRKYGFSGAVTKPYRVEELENIMHTITHQSEKGQPE